MGKNTSWLTEQLEIFLQNIVNTDKERRFRNAEYVAPIDEYCYFKKILRKRVTGVCDKFKWLRVLSAVLVGGDDAVGPSVMQH
jgi:hypothetical protein